MEIKVEHESEGNLKIHKQDSSKGSALAGAEFKIYIEKEKQQIEHLQDHHIVILN